MNIAVFFQHYTTPDCGATARHYALMAHWAERHRVTLVASDAWKRERLSERFLWVPEGVSLVNVPVAYTNRMQPVERALSFGRFAARALWSGRRMARPDVVLGVSTPLTAPAAGALTARHHGAPFVLDVKDLWPAFPVEMGAVPLAAPRRLLYGLERWLYRRAAHVVTLSPDMTAHVARIAGADAITHGRATAPVTTLYNGTDARFVDASADADVGALRRAFDIPDGPVMLYAGTFGRANNAPLLVRVAEELAARGRGTLVCIGDGYAADDLARAAARLPSLRLVPPQPRHAVFPWFRVADLTLVSFLPLPVLGTTSPAKLFDSLACGTPVVVTNDGWMRRLVDARGCGVFADAADIDGCARAAASALLDDPVALAAMSARALALYRADTDGMFNRAAHAERYEEIFARVTRDA